MGAELGRILIAAGAVAAWSGFIVLGIGMAELVPGAPFAFGLGLDALGGIITVAGLVALVVGVFIFRATGNPEPEPR